MIDQRYAPSKAVESIAAPDTPPVAVQAAPIAIGGWLILVAIGLIVTPFRIVHQLSTIHLPIFRDGHWERLTTEGSAAYHPLWASLIIFETGGSILLLVLGAVTLALFAKKSRRTPKYAIAFYAFGPSFLLLDMVSGNLIPAVASNPDPADMKELVRATFFSCIWIPYFLLSDRVKRTFTL